MARATIQDVARHAGASAASVSNYLNRPERMSPGLRSRIEASVQELGYVPHLPAQQMRRGRSQMVGVCVHNAANPFFASIVQAVEQGLEPHNLSAVVASSHESTARQDELLRMFEQLRFDGVVVTPFDDDLTTLHGLHDRGTRVVIVDSTDTADVLSSVSLDHVAGGRLAAQHLVDTGRRDLVFVSGPERVTQIADRLAGVRHVATTSGAALRVVGTAGLDLDDGRRVGAELAALPADERPDGVLAGNDVLAIGMLQTLLEAGVRVPEDVALVGYDDIDFARMTAVPLTSVRQPTADIGAVAAQLVLAGATTVRTAAVGASATPTTTDEPATDEAPPRRTLLLPELVIRASSRR